MLPAKWREKQEVGAGTELVVLEEEGRLIVQTRRQAIREAQAMVRASVMPGVSLVDLLTRERRDEVAREAPAGGRRKRA